MRSRQASDAIPTRPMTAAPRNRWPVGGVRRSTAQNRQEDPIVRNRLAALIGLVGSGAVLATWLVAAPLVSAGDPCYHGFDMPATRASTDSEIKLMPCAFSPTVTNVPVGSTVTFVNGPDFTHLITGANQAWGSRDVEVAPGRTATYEFDTAGVYPYACALHRGMSGVIVVGDAATALAAVAPSGAGTGSGASGTTTGTSNGTAATTTATTSATPAATSTPELPAVAAVSALAGGLIGAGVAWFALRRRTSGQKETVPGVA
jgi:plastocyanin